MSAHKKNPPKTPPPSKSSKPPKLTPFREDLKASLGASSPDTAPTLQEPLLTYEIDKMKAQLASLTADLRFMAREVAECSILNGEYNITPEFRLLLIRRRVELLNPPFDPQKIEL